MIDKARIVVETFLADPDFAKMRVYVQNAYGVLIIPDLLKGGFVMVWSMAPACCSPATPSRALEPARVLRPLGRQLRHAVGGQTSEAIFTVINRAPSRRS